MAIGQPARPDAASGPVGPTVSILIPAYNQERWIEACVRSALAQSYPLLEVIVSDNASTDRTGEIVSAMTGDRRLRYVRSAVNLGRVGNYRRLVHELATGDWVLVLDGDDLLTDPEYIAEAVKLARSDPGIVLVFGRMLQGPSPEQAVMRNTALAGSMVFDGDAFFLAHPPFSEVGLFHLTALYRRDHAVELDIYDRDYLSVDFDAFYRLILGRRLAFLDRPAGLWRQHGRNTSQHFDPAALLRNFEALRRPYEAAMARNLGPRSSLQRWLREANARFLLICLKAAARRWRLMDCARFIHRAAAHDPRTVLTASILVSQRIAAAIRQRAGHQR